MSQVNGEEIHLLQCALANGKVVYIPCAPYCFDIFEIKGDFAFPYDGEPIALKPACLREFFTAIPIKAP